MLRCVVPMDAVLAPRVLACREGTVRGPIPEECEGGMLAVAGLLEHAGAVPAARPTAPAPHRPEEAEVLHNP